MNTSAIILAIVGSLLFISYVIYIRISNRAIIKNFDEMIKVFERKGMHDLAEQCEMAKPRGFFQTFWEMPRGLKFILFGFFLIMSIIYAIRIWQAGG